MVHFCCVPECHQEGYRCKSGEKVSFHKFPRDKVMFKKWIIAIRRDPGPNFVVGQFTRVCSKHFKPDDYIPNVASGRRFLKDNAVPTQFVFAKPVKQRRPPKERALRCSKSLTSHLLQAASPDTDLSQRESKSDRDMTWEPSQQSEDAGQRAKGHATQNTAADLVCQSCTATFQKIQLELKARCEEVAQLSAHVQSLKRALGEARKLREDIVAVNDNNIELIAENKKLTEQLEHVKKQLQEMQRAAEDKESRAKKERKPFSLARFRDDDNSMQFYTGLSSYKHFQCFLLYLKPGENACNVYLENESTPGDVKGRPRKLEPAEELFLTLMKLKTGFFHLHLGHIFGVSASTVSRVFSGWINFMYIQLGKLTLWVPRSKIDRHMPPAFRELYPSTRVIIDATEVKCEVPSSLVLQSGTYSTYKSANTFKALIGVAPNGLLTFASELFMGSLSDREIVIRSGFLDLNFAPGDTVMADKGFKIKDLLQEKGVGLNLPPFLTQKQFEEDDVQRTQEIASLRIHVERRIQRIKCYHIFDKAVPLSLGPLINQVWSVCAVLSNMQSPLITESG
ncbi:uncharacterized protein [Dermacentor albipictus]|uniref:uncharacterized protein n=1 Tax=Dermacentor albipictus TaxID=60249 RepID=UPI0038FC145D